MSAEKIIPVTIPKSYLRIISLINTGLSKRMSQVLDRNKLTVCEFEWLFGIPFMRSEMRKKYIIMYYSTHTYKGRKKIKQISRRQEEII